ncbi:hypothetical protein [uncultured Clostridium sp.]|uniref:hypothetical protein n=1 Tax=uncultured Clostridium sp. TaxID=59620 RepID=UPI0026232626|nr:hypothetical protein [uncultured Clostridium sp.]
MLRNDDMINVYNDYDNKIFAPSVDPRGNDLVFPPKTEDGEPYYVYLPFSEIRNMHRLDKNIFTKRKLRFELEMEEEIFRMLNINLAREAESFTRKDIEYMILNPDDNVINTILSITNKSVIDMFLSQLIYLKNTNKYFIADKVENYIRARKEELEQGLRKSELEGQPTENIPVVDEEVETGVVNEEAKIEKSKNTRVRKTTNK